MPKKVASVGGNENFFPTDYFSFVIKSSGTERENVYIWSTTTIIRQNIEEMGYRVLDVKG